MTTKGERLVRVERFEELRVGMRVVIKSCGWIGGRNHRGILGTGLIGKFSLVNGSTEIGNGFPVLGSRCAGTVHYVSRRSIRSGRVYRFASDLGIDNELAREENPYLSRSVLGTEGREETRVLSKERGR